VTEEVGGRVVVNPAPIDALASSAGGMNALITACSLALSEAIWTPAVTAKTPSSATIPHWAILLICSNTISHPQTAHVDYSVPRPRYSGRTCIHPSSRQTAYPSIRRAIFAVRLAGGVTIRSQYHPCFRRTRGGLVLSTQLQSGRERKSKHFRSGVVLLDLEVTLGVGTFQRTSLTLGGSYVEDLDRGGRCCRCVDQCRSGPDRRNCRPHIR
jgi:hypothetical protein